MATVNSSLRFETTARQSLWTPGAATELRVDSGDALLWNPGEYSRPINTDTFLGFGAKATFYAGAKFGLQAYANLGDGGSFEASYDIDIEVDLPGAVVAGDLVTFTYDYNDVKVSNAKIETIGFGNSIDPNVPIGAGLDLIVQISAGLRDVTLINPFKDINLGTVSFINRDDRISLFSVDPTEPLFEIELTEGVTLFGRLPTGANIEASSTGSAIIEGDGFSETKFLELEADLDALLVRLLDKIPLPPVKAIAKFLGEVVFAEHTFDPNDFVSAIPKGKLEFNFTLLDITASAGLVITEDVKLDIAGDDGVTPYLKVEIESESTGQVATGYLGLAGQTKLDLALAASASGIGTDDFTATYSIEEATFTHGVGLGISASITITVLEGNLSGDWVPSALRFSFGPLAEVEIPEGGLNIDLGNFYEDTFALADDAFNTQTDQYSVFYTDVVPDGWNKNLQSAEQDLYIYAQAFLENVAATQAEYSESGFNVTVANGTSPINLSGTANAMYVWQGATTNSVTIGTDNNSIVTIDVDPPVGGAEGALLFRGTPAEFGSKNWKNAVNSINDNDRVFINYLTDSNINTLSFNHSANMVGGNRSDFLALYGSDADFFDGGSQGNLFGDVFAANFATDGHADVSINFDFHAGVVSGNGTDLDIGGGKTVTIVNFESLAIKTGAADDNIVTSTDQDYVDTSGGDDVVDVTADVSEDVILLGDGDDVVTYAFRSDLVIGQNFTDELFGGTGTDHAYVTTGAGGLRYDIVTDFSGSTPNYLFSKEGVGFDGSHAEFSALQREYFNQFTSLQERPTLDYEAGLNTDERGYLLINGAFTNGAVEVSADIENVNILDGGLDANDLVLFTGGTRYDGGLGDDTFIADFEAFNAVSETVVERGVYLDASVGGGNFGNIEVLNFERFDVYGTVESDVILGGVFEDYIDGGDLGDDVLYGGNDTVRDVIFAKGGDDIVKWSVDGADFINAGSGVDKLLIEADGTETRELRLSFRDAANSVFAGADPFYYSLDSNALLLDAMGFAAAMFADDGYLGINYDSATDDAVAGRFEIIDIRGSVDQNDLLMYLNGTDYRGGESLNDSDVFVADFSSQAVGIQFDINKERGAGDDTGSLLTNGVFVSGVERAVIKAGSANDLLIGGALKDHFDGGGGADIFMGHEGTNTLIGGAGKDLFYYSGTGDDTIDGGDGTDSLIIGTRETGTATSRVTLRDADGGILGNGSFVTNSSNGGTLVSRAIEIQNGTAVNITYDFGDHSVSYEDIEIADIAGTDNQNDLIFYQNGEAYFGGAGGVDEFAGDFSAFSEDLYFTARGATGEKFNIGQGTTLADFESFSLNLGAGNDEVIGGLSTDYVVGGAGNDYFDGGLGSDTFDGGAGNDTYVHIGGVDRVFMGSGDHDTIKIGGLTSVGDINGAMGFLVGNGLGGTVGGDVIQNADGTLDVSAFANVLADLQSFGHHQTYQYGTNTTSYSLTAVDAEHFDIIGSDFNDVLVAGVRGSTLVGGAGDDFLVSYNDEVDLLTGGVGADTYVILGKLGGSTVIGDEYDVGSRLHFDAFAQADIQFFASNNDLFVSAFDGVDGSVDVVIKDYFSNGATAGLNFEFSASDSASFFFTPGTSNGTQRIIGSTTVGTTDDDDLKTETANADSVIAFEGNDQVMGSRGSDVINTGLGSDGISYVNSTEAVFVSLEAKEALGGDAEGDILIGVEQIYGSEFDDSLEGDHTDNTLFGAQGNDDVGGGDGEDRVFGGLGDDFVSGGDGDDAVFGEEGDDAIEGGDGDDQVDGGAGDDMLYGGDGSDLLEGGLGRNVIMGEDGDDVHLYTGGIDLFDGGEGTDTTSFSNFEFGVKIDLRDTLLASTSLTESFDETVSPVVLARFDSVENAVGTQFGDVIIGGTGSNVFTAGDGDDILVGDAGSDLLDGGTGLDVVDYSQEAGGGAVLVDLSGSILAPALALPTEIDVALDTFGEIDILRDIEGIVGTGLNDSFYGDAQDNAFTGNAGDDVIYGNAGNDTIEGGDGNDFLYGNGFGSTELTDDDVINGGAGNDLIVGHLGNDVLNGGDGDDTLEGNVGDDLLFGGLGNDTLNGGAGNDVADYRSTTQGITVNTSGANDIVTGAEVGTDTLTNILFALGGLGNDMFTGGGGTDVFGYFGGRDTFIGGTGIDFVYFDYHTGAISVDLSGFANEVKSNGTDDLSIGNLTTIADLNGIEAIRGTEFGDEFVGFANDTGFLNYFDGRDGNDTITGGAGSQNELYGGRGNDTFVGFLDLDTVDISIFDGGFGFDLFDFSDHADAIFFSLEFGDSNDTIVDVEGLIGSEFSDYLGGNALNNVFEANGGDDEVYGLDGADLFRYISGLDQYFGGSGSDTLDLSLQSQGFALQDGVGVSEANLGTSDPSFFYENIENFIGSNSNDLIFGGAADNLFNDGLGDDQVFGEGGDDLFTYAGGSDTWDGGDGTDAVNFANFGSAVDIDLDFAVVRTSDDTVFTESFDVRTIVSLTNFENLSGTQFSDILTGNAGDNQFVAGAGDDVIRTGGGDDVVRGGDGEDTVSFVDIFAGVTFDLANTGVQSTVGAGDVTVSGVENITGSVLNDTLFGDDKDNVINGFGGDDVLDGRTGNDRFVYIDGLSVIDGGDGIDTLDLSANGTAVSAILNDQPGMGIRKSTGADHTTGSLTTIAEVQSVENLIGTRFNDLMIGDSQDNVLEGGAGADDILGGAGTDTVSYTGSDDVVTVNLATGVHTGGDAQGDVISTVENILGSLLGDTLTGDDTTNRIEGSGGDDTIDGMAGDDILAGGLGIDTLTGGLGLDAISGGQGDDVIDGGDGADYLFGDEGEDDVQGGAGDDEIDGGLGADTVEGGEGDDIIIDSYDVLGGADVLSGNSGNDKIFGGFGADTLNGNIGDDILVGGIGDDVINGGSGIDIASYEDADAGVNVYLLFTGLDTGGAGVDTLSSIEGLTGSNFQDRLIGDAFDNILTGGLGDDILKGKGGNDTFHGGEGDDFIFGFNGDDMLFGGAGSDRLFALGGNDELHGGDDRDFLYGGRDSDVLFGDGGNDVLRGNIGNDALSGGAGQDDLRGGGGNDTIGGGTGNDFLLGQNGSDMLAGGEGDDTLIGGNGAGIFDGVADTFYYFTDFNGSDEQGFGGFDRVRDFEDNVDKLNLEDIGFADFAELLTFTTEAFGGVRIDFGEGDVFFIENYSLADFDEGDVIL